ncbi:MAG: hypoxanthine phosphoribosyltransferase [candidate division Zixibacteria bacterium]|nr:hypoxanthine phosphoribosyltransferase [candidate division Zixibacteria bacterium]
MKNEILIDEKQIQKRVIELATQINADYQNKNPILVGVLKGSFVFLADLVRKLNIPHQIDFLGVASYDGDVQSSGVVRLIADLSVNIESRHVIIVEDIIDTGITTDYIVKNLSTRNPASLEFVVLLDKKECRKVDIPVKYTGFEIPDQFVVGYGLDYNQQYRNLPYIARL